MDSGGRDAYAACGDLAARDLSALMTLGVWAGFESVSVDELLIGADVLLKSVQIKNESRRHELAQASPFSYQFGIGWSQDAHTPHPVGSPRISVMKPTTVDVLHTRGGNASLFRERNLTA